MRVMSLGVSPSLNGKFSKDSIGNNQYNKSNVSFGASLKGLFKEGCDLYDCLNIMQDNKRQTAFNAYAAKIKEYITNVYSTLTDSILKDRKEAVGLVKLSYSNDVKVIMNNQKALASHPNISALITPSQKGNGTNFMLNRASGGDILCNISKDGTDFLINIGYKGKRLMLSLNKLFVDGAFFNNSQK